MVEGHQCHRVAAAHRKLLLHKRFEATSPNGRFTEGAAAVNNRALRRIEVHGKNLFYFFSNSEAISTAQLIPPPRQAVAAGPPTPAPAAVADDGGPSTPAVAAPPAKRARKTAGSRREQATAAPPADEVQTATPPTNTAAEEDPAAAGVTAVAAQTADSTSDDDLVVVVRIHFGMSGAFRVHNSLTTVEPTATTRLALTHKQLGLVAYLSAMTVEHGALDLYWSAISKLGPDPLREDADKEVLWRSVQKSKKPIGLVLMSQDMIAGLGNIYRAEVLFKAGVHPEQPSSTITKEQFDRLWFHSVDLLQRGFVSGSILTVDPQEAKVLGKPWTRRYIYNQERCGRCKGVVRSWDMASRTVYCCENCQPLKSAASTTTAGASQQCVGTSSVAVDGAQQPAMDTAGPSTPAATIATADLVSPARRKAMAQAKPAKLFKSHCAPDSDADEGVTGVLAVPDKMTVPQLKAELKSLSMSTLGKKADLVARLTTARVAVQTTTTARTEMADNMQQTPIKPQTVGRKRRAEDSQEDGEADSEDELDRAEAILAANLGVPPAEQPAPATSAAASAGPSTAGDGSQQQPGAAVPEVLPGSQRFVKVMASAKDAALEKMRAGESRAVEHVALADDETDALVAGAGQSGRKRRVSRPAVAEGRQVRRSRE